MTIPVKVPVRTTTKIDLTPTNSICLKMLRSLKGGLNIQARTETNRRMIFPISSTPARTALPRRSKAPEKRFI